MSTIIVKKNAPGWPAMVATSHKTIKKSEELTKMKESSAAASMWLKKQYSQTNNGNANEECKKQVQQARQSSMFAPKIVRQCANCQVLYTNYHFCQDESEATPKWSEK